MRAIEKKRPPFMTRRKWTVLTLFLILLIIVGIIFFYRYIHKGIWQETSEMREVIEQASLYNLDEQYVLNKYIWEDRYWILLAQSNVSEEMIYSAWSTQEQLAELPYEEAMTKEEMLAHVEASKPYAQNIKLQPGYMYGQLVWEIKYKDTATEHLKIAFYRMTDGNFIDEYTIPKETRP
ncbi:hypothetical protein [Paenibacillus sp. FSL W7-1287]|uniref:hypothetical protein n=1 Tax=Paenibacillus sp. FSL W7-1287 TaxID=2954538 RepID=UPI0030FBFB10